jgi:hypothetical protein
MKTNCIKLICGLALLGAVAQVSAAPFVYTGTTVASGSLGGVDFFDAAITLTTTGDSTNIVNLGFSYVLGETTTIQIDGLNLATFNGADSFGVISMNFESYGVVGFVRYGHGLDAILALNETFPTYDLATVATFTGPGGGDFLSYSTDQGDLLFTGTSGNTTFSAIPEPATVLSLLLGSLILTGYRRFYGRR